jgi:fructose-1,6-bisphosphatase/inositol monophosphatase family enzyme
MVCTSIGLTVKGVPVVGVIYNPFMDQLVCPSEECSKRSPTHLTTTLEGVGE